MITEQQVNDYIATQFYTPETAHQARIDIKWAIEQMQAETANMTPTDQYEADMGVQRAMIGDLLKENEKLKPGQWYPGQPVFPDVESLSDVIKELRAENERLRGELSEILRIAERGDVNVQPLLAPIIEKAKNALK